MDLLRSMAANRHQQGIVAVQQPTGKPTSRPAIPGTRAMRKFIIAEKPGKKVVKEHLEAIIAQECESSSEEED